MEHIRSLYPSDNEGVDSKVLSALEAWTSVLMDQPFSVVEAKTCLTQLVAICGQKKQKLSALKMHYESLLSEGGLFNISLFASLIILRHEMKIKAQQESLVLNQASALVDALPPVEQTLELLEILHQNAYDFNDDCMNQNGYSSLVMSVAYGQSDVLPWLLEHGAQVNPRKNKDFGSLGSALVHAIAAGNLEATDLLMQYGANINEKDHQGKTPLMYAVSFAYQDQGSDIVRLLVKGGAKVNAQTSDGWTIWHQVARSVALNRNPAPISLLLEIGASANTQDQDKNTVLHTLLNGLSPNLNVSSCLEFMREAYVQGVSLDAVNDHGEAVIHIAARFDHLEIVQWLVEHGANLSVPNRICKKAKEIAHVRGNSQVAHYLEAVELARAEEVALRKVLKVGKTRFARFASKTPERISQNEDGGNSEMPSSAPSVPVGFKRAL